MTAPFYYPQEQQPEQQAPLSPEEQAQQEQMALVQQSMGYPGKDPQQSAGDMDEALDAPGLKFREKLRGPAESWPEQVLNSFYQDYPALSQSNPQVRLLRSDDARGYAVGVIQFPEAPGVSIPFSVSDFSLKPFSVILKGEDVSPLTEERLEREFISSPAQGVLKATDREYQSAVEDAEFDPPSYYSGPGMASDTGSSVIGKISHVLIEDFESMVKAAHDIGLDLPHVEKFKLTVAAPSWRSILLEIGDSRSDIRTTVIGPDFTKVSAVRPARDVMPHLRREDAQQLLTSGYLVKSAFEPPPVEEEPEEGMSPPEEGMEEEAAEAPEEGAVSAEPPMQAPPEPELRAEDLVSPEETREDGLYEVRGVDGNPLVGMVFHRVYDLNGGVAPLKVFIDSGWETSATQPSILGQRIGPVDPEMFVGHTPTQPDRENIMVFHPPGEPPAVTVPFHVESIVQNENGPTWQVETFLGDRYTVSRIEGLMVPTELEPGHVAVGDFQLIELPDPAKRSVLLSTDNQFSYEAFDELMNPSQLKISSDNGLYTLNPCLGGEPYLSAREAEAFLKAAGVSNPRPILKQANLRTVTLRGSIPEVKVNRWEPTPAPANRPSAEKIASWARALVSVNEDPSVPKFLKVSEDTVDNVLSLGFLRPENTRDFVNNTGLLEQASKALAQLALASDLGYTQIPEHEVRSAMLALEEVVRSLRQIGQTMTDNS